MVAILTEDDAGVVRVIARDQGSPFGLEACLVTSQCHTSRHVTSHHILIAISVLYLGRRKYKKQAGVWLLALS